VVGPAAESEGTAPSTQLLLSNEEGERERAVFQERSLEEPAHPADDASLRESTHQPEDELMKIENEEEANHEEVQQDTLPVLE